MAKLPKDLEQLMEQYHGIANTLESLKPSVGTAYENAAKMARALKKQPQFTPEMLEYQKIAEEGQKAEAALAERIEKGYDELKSDFYGELSPNGKVSHYLSMIGYGLIPQNKSKELATAQNNLSIKQQMEHFMKEGDINSLVAYVAEKFNGADLNAIATVSTGSSYHVDQNEIMRAVSVLSRKLVGEIADEINKGKITKEIEKEISAKGAYYHSFMNVYRLYSHSTEQQYRKSAVSSKKKN